MVDSEREGSKCEMQLCSRPAPVNQPARSLMWGKIKTLDVLWVVGPDAGGLAGHESGQQKEIRKKTKEKNRKKIK